MTYRELLNAALERRQRRWELRHLQKSLRIAAGATLLQRINFPSERQWVTLGAVTLAGSMLKMAEFHRDLWNVELFKTLLNDRHWPREHGVRLPS